MFELKNVISVGDYESKAISAKFGALILNTEGVQFINLDPGTVKAFSELPNPKRKNAHAVYIAFRNGKKSIVDVDKKVFAAFNSTLPRNDDLKVDEKLIRKYYGADK